MPRLRSASYETTKKLRQTSDIIPVFRGSVSFSFITVLGCVLSCLRDTRKLILMVSSVNSRVVQLTSLFPLQVSVWILVAIVLLFISNVLYLVAFLSQGWGWVDLPPEEGRDPDWWDFGLWQCCRHSDGVCRGPRWPGFFVVSARKLFCF